MADLAQLIKLHKVENDPAKQGMLIKLIAEDEKSQAENRKALVAQRSADGHVSAICPKCGVESVFDAKNKSAKCGAMTGVREVKDADGNKHNVPAACGTALAA